MIVVSDTSPLNYLVLIDAIDVLPKLFDEIHVPVQVMAELVHPRTPEPVKRWAMSPPEWLHIGSPKLIISSVSLLDEGEAHAISLAAELHAAAILIDEKKGRRVAKQEGFTTLGTITVLELAARQNLLVLRSAFDVLLKTSFQINSQIIDAAMERDRIHRLSLPGS